MRGLVAVAGVGESEFYKQGKAPCSEFELTLRAILNSCSNAGIDPSEIDGFASYASEFNNPLRLAAALNLPHVSYSNKQWMGGGGGAAAAVANAAAAIVSGQAKCVIVFRGLAQGQTGRYGRYRVREDIGDAGHLVPYGVLSAPQILSMKVTRFMHEHNVRQEALRAVSLVGYHHAQSNPRAVMHGRPLDAATYDSSRWIAEPYHLYDCCMENDGAGAMVLVSAERAKDLRNPPCYVLSAGCSIDHRAEVKVHNNDDYGSSGFKALAKNLYADAGVQPDDIDVLQAYENFTGGVVMAAVECGFCRPDEVNQFFTPENLTLGGSLPLNTSGGHLAEGYIHGMNLLIEGVRQIYGESSTQVESAHVSMVTGGPMAPPVSACIFGSGDTL